MPTMDATHRAPADIPYKHVPQACAREHTPLLPLNLPPVKHELLWPSLSSAPTNGAGVAIPTVRASCKPPLAPLSLPLAFPLSPEAHPSLDFFQGYRTRRVSRRPHPPVTLPCQAPFCNHFRRPWSIWVHRQTPPEPPGASGASSRAPKPSAASSVCRPPSCCTSLPEYGRRRWCTDVAASHRSDLHPTVRYRFVQ
jgi:hypothetical protein